MYCFFNLEFYKNSFTLYVTRIIENFDNFAYYLLCFLLLLFISYSGQFLFEYLVKCFSVTFQTSENVKIANLIYSMRYEDIEKMNQHI